MKNVGTIFDEHCSHVIFDSKLLRRIMIYEHNFVNKNDSHINFFGGVLMGVDPVRFTPKDRAEWFDDILDVDEEGIRQGVATLPDILMHRKVSSDIMNLSCFWMAHKFLTSKHLNENDRQLGAMTCVLIFHYKIITSTLTSWFSYTADPIVAQATYSALSKKYGLKVAGSWGELLKNRSEITVAKDSLHYKRIMNFNNDLDIVYVLNDTHGRVKSILKHIRDVFSIVQRSPDQLVKSISSTIELDGEVKIRDKTRLTTSYVRYLLDTLGDKRSFMVPELIGIISRLVSTAPQVSIEKTLEYMSDNSSVLKDKRVETLCRLTLQHAFDYLTRNPTVMASGSDIPGLLKKMRDLYQASRGSDEQVLEMRSIAEAIATDATKSKNKIMISSVRNAVLLYIILRTFTMNHYKK